MCDVHWCHNASRPIFNLNIAWKKREGLAQRYAYPPMCTLLRKVTFHIFVYFICRIGGNSPSVSRSAASLTTTQQNALPSLLFVTASCVRYISPGWASADAHLCNPARAQEWLRNAAHCTAATAFGTSCVFSERQRAQCGNKSCPELNSGCRSRVFNFSGVHFFDWNSGRRSWKVCRLLLADMYTRYIGNFQTKHSRYPM